MDIQQGQGVTLEQLYSELLRIRHEMLTEARVQAMINTSLRDNETRVREIVDGEVSPLKRDIKDLRKLLTDTGERLQQNGDAMRTTQSSMHAMSSTFNHAMTEVNEVNAALREVKGMMTAFMELIRSRDEQVRQLHEAQRTHDERLNAHIQEVSDVRGRMLLTTEALTENRDAMRQMVQRVETYTQQNAERADTEARLAAVVAELARRERERAERERVQQQRIETLKVVPRLAGRLLQAVVRR